MRQTLAVRRTRFERSGTLLVEVMLCMVIGTMLIGVITSIFVRVVVMDPHVAAASRDHDHAGSSGGTVSPRRACGC